MKYVVAYNREGDEEMVNQQMIEANSTENALNFMYVLYPNVNPMSIIPLSVLVDNCRSISAFYNPDVVATSKLAKVQIASEDYNIGGKEVNGVHYFTYNEALDVQEKLKDTGWRLPTRSEWVLICEEFGQKDGQLDTDTLYNNLHMSPTGYFDYASTGPYFHKIKGLWWSSTLACKEYANNLYVSTNEVCPKDSTYLDCRFALHLVKDVEESNE